jgi:hypothetical protein
MYEKKIILTSVIDLQFQLRKVANKLLFFHSDFNRPVTADVIGQMTHA